MVELVEDLQGLKQLYVLNTNIWRTAKMNYAVYSISNLEQKGVNNWFARLSTNAFKSSFPKIINVKGLGLNLRSSSYKGFSDRLDMIKEYCLILKKDPEKNPKLTQKMMGMYPQYFV